MATVLVTCVGSGVGQSIIDSLNLKREHRIIGCDGNSNIYARSYCDDFITVPSIYAVEYVNTVLQICTDHKVDILIPGHDHELILFSSKVDLFAERGIQVLVSEPRLIEISRDKQEWYNFFSKYGCKIVPTFSVKSFKENPDASILPAIVKPSGGSASQGISIINDLIELIDLDDHDIIQPYLFPEETDKNYKIIKDAVKRGEFIQRSEISIQLMFSVDAKFSGIFISKNTLKNGVPVFIDPIDPKKFAYTAEILKFVPVLEDHGVKGPVNIQGRITSSGLFFFEMNMRFTGITGNRALLGFNEVDHLVNSFLGRDNRPIDGFSTNKLGVRQVACATIPRAKEDQKKAIITVLGAGSSIGQVFVSQMLAKFDIFNLIVRSSSIEKYKALFPYENIKIITANDPNLEEALCRTDIFVNFVSALAYESELLKFEAIRYVYGITTKVAKSSIPLVINISSQSVYPQDVNIPKCESHDLSYNGSYAFQKVIMEDFFQFVKSLNPASQVVSLRLSRVIIPQVFNQSGFFGKLIERYTNDEIINIDLPQNNTNLIHISDVIDSIEFLIENRFNVEFPNILNVSGNNITLEHYCNTIEESVNGGGKFLLSDSKTVETSSMIEGKLFSELGWRATRDVHDIISDLVKSLKNKR